MQTAPVLNTPPRHPAYGIVKPPTRQQAIRALCVILSSYPDVYQSHQSEIEYYKELFLTPPTGITPGARRMELVRRVRFGFCQPEDVKALASDPDTRLTPLLVRCHEGRFTAPAQDIETFVSACERAGLCVRDVSLISD